MPVIPSIPYSQIRGSLKTGDLFFFYGTSGAAIFIEDLEGLVGWPPYSHVGMVIISEQGGERRVGSGPRLLEAWTTEA